MQKIIYLSLEDVKKIGISMKEVVEITERVYMEKGNGRYEMPPKPGIHPRPDSFIHAMPSYLPELGAAGMKWVSGFPENQKKNLPYISGLLILNDPGTGIPICVMDCTWITAARTGASTAVAAKYLARPDSRVIAIIACGVQGRTNLEALAVIFKDIELVKAYDIHRESLDRYVQEMKEKFSFPIVAVRSAREAVVGSDIIVTSGPILKHPSPVIEDSWFAKGAFACPLDFDSYWRGDALVGADAFFTDDESQLRYYQQSGYFKTLPGSIRELHDVVAGKLRGRKSPEERIISMNLGISLLDMGCARVIYDRATSLGIGMEMPL